MDYTERYTTLVSNNAQTAVISTLLHLLQL